MEGRFVEDAVPEFNGKTGYIDTLWAIYLGRTLP